MAGFYVSREAKFHMEVQNWSSLRWCYFQIYFLFCFDLENFKHTAPSQYVAKLQPADRLLICQITEDLTGLIDVAWQCFYLKLSFGISGSISQSGFAHLYKRLV